MRRAAFAWLVLVVACSDDAEAPLPQPKVRQPATLLPPLASAPTTLTRTLVPRTPRAALESGPNPALPLPLADYIARGFGELDVGAGEPVVVRTLDGSGPPLPGPNAHRLVRFAHLADMQLGDDESPTRIGIFDSAGPTAPALRPQDAYLCRMANAAVRTINALHASDPFAFTLLGGDNADSAQTNEVDWVLGILGAGGGTSPVEVECDSGDDDEIEPGPDNDGKDPFLAAGLQMPWKWVTGNHDVLVQGNLRPSEHAARALGDDAGGGTRHYEGGKRGEVIQGPVVADPRRALLMPTDLMAKVSAHGDGHGLGAPESATGRATYTFDVAGTPLRFLVIDTAHERGGSDGVITQREVDRVVRPALDRAKREGKWLFLASHHAAASLGNGGGLGGDPQADALTPEAWTTLLGQYDNVLFSMVGHSHQHRVTPIRPASGHAYWEVMTAAIADWPHQLRVIELFDQDNGWLMLRGVAVDISTEGDAPAAEGKRRGVIDLTAGWLPSLPGEVDEPGDRNVELWIKKP